MTPKASERTLDLWQRLVAVNQDYQAACLAFLAEKTDRVTVLREALRGPHRATALALARSLSADELTELFPELIHLARAAHGPFESAWQLILSLPRDWVLAHIEAEVEPILSNQEEDDYWMFLQLFQRLEEELAFRLAQRAASHSSPVIRELGEEFLQRVSQQAK